jgi:hypothetical protein
MSHNRCTPKLLFAMVQLFRTIVPVVDPTPDPELLPLMLLLEMYRTLEVAETIETLPGFSLIEQSCIVTVAPRVTLMAPLELAVRVEFEIVTSAELPVIKTPPAFVAELPPVIVRFSMVASSSSASMTVIALFPLMVMVSDVLDNVKVLVNVIVVALVKTVGSKLMIAGLVSVLALATAVARLPAPDGLAFSTGNRWYGETLS